MAIFKRIGLFIAVNILVVLTISLILNILGVGPYLNAYGMDYSALAAFCLVWGMVGAFISLALSRIMAKWMMGVKVIAPNTQNSQERALLETVHGLARSAGLSTMPEVGYYESPEVNAFATGPTKARSLVAVSTGLLQRMDSDQVRGVLGHEIAHIANGDMVTMTLIQGVVNAFVMFLARVIAFAISNAGRNNERESVNTGFAYHMTVWVLEMVLMLFGSMVVAWFSRHREFRADKGGAKLAGRQSMINALQGLQRSFGQTDVVEGQPALQAMKISGRPGGFLRLFATHPPLEERIARLQRELG